MVERRREQQNYGDRIEKLSQKDLSEDVLGKIEYYAAELTEFESSLEGAEDLGVIEAQVNMLIRIVRNLENQCGVDNVMVFDHNNAEEDSPTDQYRLLIGPIRAPINRIYNKLKKTIGQIIRTSDEPAKAKTAMLALSIVGRTPGLMSLSVLGDKDGVKLSTVLYQLATVGKAGSELQQQQNINGTALNRKANPQEKDDQFDFELLVSLLEDLMRELDKSTDIDQIKTGIVTASGRTVTGSETSVGLMAELIQKVNQTYPAFNNRDF